MNEYLIMGIVIAIIILIVGFLIIFNGPFRRLAYKMFLYAENNVVKGRKMDYVVSQIYESLPAICRLLPESFYKKVLQKMFDEIKDLLDDGKINNSNEV